MNSYRHSWVVLSLVPGLGVATLWRLVTHFSSPQAVLAATPKQLLQVPGIAPRFLQGLLDGKKDPRTADAEFARLDRLGGKVVVWGDRQYPELLTQLSDPPPVLYTRGDLSLLQGPALALVGSRAASSYGLRVASDLSAALARAGSVIVSGLAAGIDAAAHRGALAATKRTIAVLGCGLDQVYPRQNAVLYEEIAAKGLLISEYPLGTRPAGFRFPARNRIVAGLAAGVVVVEAARKSGALITAQIALDHGREVFAVPGQMDSFKSEGCHLLIRSGAVLVSRVEDILAEVPLKVKEEGLSLEARQHPEKNTEVARVLHFIDSYPVAKDVLVEKTGLSPGRINELSLLLELEGVLESLPGDQVRRID